MPTRSLSDIEAIEAQPISSHALPESTYEALLASAKRNPRAKALTFFLAASSYNRAHTWTYAEFIAEVTRAANTFHTFGVTSDHPVAFVTDCSKGADRWQCRLSKKRTDRSALCPIGDVLEPIGGFGPQRLGREPSAHRVTAASAATSAGGVTSTPIRRKRLP
jgi:hypothetical protein